MLSYHGYSEVALPILEASQQQFERNVNEASLVTLSGIWMTESVYQERVQRAMVVALIRAGDFEQAQIVLKTASPALTDIASVDPISQLLVLVVAVEESPHFSLPDAQRRILLAEAEAIALQFEDDVQKLQALIRIADAHIDAGDVDAAGYLADAVASSFAVAQPFVMPHDYAQFLLGIGEYEQAIALAEARSDDSDLSSLLPSYLVSVGQYDLAEDQFKALPTIEIRATSLRFMTAAYYQQNRADLANALTARVLSEIESSEFDTEVAAHLGPNYPETLRIYSVERARIYAAIRALRTYTANYSIEPYDVTSETLEATAIELVKALDSDLLRREVMVELFSTQRALALLEQDEALAAPDSLLLRLTVDAADSGEFRQAEATAVEVRSPYLQAQALAYIALRYGSAATESDR
ncbi:MAG: hypothetical protein ABG776_11530 [Cyanobacteria bacterium J06555_13]